MDNTFVIKSNLGAIDYIMLVNDIVSQYFDSDGEYVPHVGLLNAMRLFYNHCVLESKFDSKINHYSDSLEDIGVLVADDDFIKEFNDALVTNGRKLDFGNAFCDAMDIVNTRKSSLNQMVSILKNAVDSISNRIAPALTQENINNIGSILSDMSEGKISMESIIENYSKSQRVQELIEKVRAHEDDTKE